MTLAAGARLGPYEILAPLGAGGMGEVYRARDTRLGREVAIKVLPAELRADRERLSRFEKEARSASALNHPSIVTIHDIGESEGVSYIAMELVAGQTLRELLVDGALPTKRTLHIAAQVTDGLARAHEAGIVHRDLKPENVMVTRDGFAKILDFGLAKLTETEKGSATHAPTQTSGATGPGVVMGTVGYMSPEQALGKPLDARSDQFSFGSILYEMATGKRAFARGSAPETLSAIIRDEPEPMGALAPLTPIPLRWIVERCLAKDPADRYASTRDLSRDLSHLRDHLSETSVSGFSAAGPPRRRRFARLVPWLLAAALLLALLAIWRGRRPAPSAESPTQFLLNVPSSAYLVTGPSTTGLAVSPDGRRIAFVAGTGMKSRLWVRALEAAEAASLPGTEGAIGPFWSPDSRQIGFFGGGRLQRVAVSGGPPQTICESGLGNHGTWGPGGIILFGEGSAGSGAILRVSAEGGTPVPITKPDTSKSERAFGWPHFLPDGRHFLMLKGGQNLGEGAEKGIVCLGTLDSPEVKPLFEADSRVEYAPPGYLLFVRDSTLLAQPFDPKRLALSGDAIPVAPAIWYFRHTGAGTFSASARANLLVYQLPPYDSRLMWLDRGGRTVSTVGDPAKFSYPPRLSPDGRRIAATVRDPRSGKRDLWIYDAATGLPTRQTFQGRDAVFPAWSPDGSRMAYGSFREGPPNIYVRDLASGREELLFRGPGAQLPNDWSRDGARIAYRDVLGSRQPSSRIAFLALGAKPVEESTPNVPFNQYDARFSPDGRWMSLVSEESGESEVYVVPAGGVGERRRVSSEGGDRPRWRRDGRELYFLSKENRLMVVPVAFAASGIELGEPRALFLAGETAVDYDPAPDGERFLFVISSGRGQPPLMVNLNWAAGLPK